MIARKSIFINDKIYGPEYILADKPLVTLSRILVFKGNHDDEAVELLKRRMALFIHYSGIESDVVAKANHQNVMIILTIANKVMMQRWRSFVWLNHAVKRQ